MTAPATIAGQIEVRGIGILRVPCVAAAPLRLVVDLVPSAEVERMPSHAPVCSSGLRVPAHRAGALRSIGGGEATAALRVSQARRRAGGPVMNTVPNLPAASGSS